MEKERLDEAYRAALRPLARRRLRRLAAEAGALWLAPAIGSLFGEPAVAAESERLAPVEALRARIEAGSGGEVLLVRDGSARLPRTGRQLARRSSVPAAWGLLLHRLAAGSGAARILELGSCSGVSGGYLATAPSCERFVGIEASPALAHAAADAVAALSPDATVLAGLFADRLDDALDALAGRVDLVFVDGERRPDGLLDLFARLRPALRPGAVVVVDDVRVTRPFLRAWRAGSARRTSLDLGRLGIALEQPGRATSLAALTGVWLARKPLPSVS